MVGFCQYSVSRIAEAVTKGHLSEVLERICERVGFLVKLQIVGNNLIKNEFLHEYGEKFLSLVTLSDIGRTSQYE